MGCLNDDLADRAALIDVDLIEDFLLAGSGGLSHRFLGERLPYLQQPRLPASHGDRRGAQRSRAAAAAGLEEIAGKVVPVVFQVVVQNQRSPWFGEEGRNVAGLDLAAEVVSLVDSEDGSPKVLARWFGLGRRDAVTEHFESAVLPTELRLILDAVADDRKQFVGRHSRDRDAFGLEVGGTTETHVGPTPG